MVLMRRVTDVDRRELAEVRVTRRKHDKGCDRKLRIRWSGCSCPCGARTECY